MDSMLNISRNVISKDFLDLNNKIEHPVLLLFGEGGAFSKEEITELNQFFCNSKTVIIPDTGHWIHGDSPLPFLNHVVPFLKDWIVNTKLDNFFKVCKFEIDWA